MGISVSGNSPNCVKALDWAKAARLADPLRWSAPNADAWLEIANKSSSSTTPTIGRVEDAQMGICTCFATRSWRTRRWQNSALVNRTPA